MVEFISQIKKYRTILGMRFFLKKIFCSIMPINEVSDSRFRTLFWNKRCVKYLKRYALRHKEYAINRINTGILTNTIWVLWLQGEEQMPEIVKRCYQSLRHYCKNFEIRLLTESNMKEYIELPDRIVSQYASGYIPIALFSDLIRIELLATYGGIWIDSTVLLTGNIPKEILASEVFFYQTSKLEYFANICSSWFIFCKQPNNYIIHSIRNTLYEYWEKERYPINPFMFHLTISALYEIDDRFRGEWEKMPYLCNMNPHVLWFSADKNFKDALWKNILKTSTIHKLSWKIDEKKYTTKSVLHFLLNNESLEK